MDATTVAVDLAKTVFELAIANAQWRVVSRQRLNRARRRHHDWPAVRDYPIGQETARLHQQAGYTTAADSTDPRSSIIRLHTGRSPYTGC